MKYFAHKDVPGEIVEAALQVSVYFLQNNIKEYLLRVSIFEGKYTIIQEDDEGLHLLRYGKFWSEYNNDDLIISFAEEVQNLREKLARNA